jgi:CRP-like cAMP-binding protein
MPGINRFIEALTPDTKAHLLAQARHVDLPQGTLLARADEQIHYAYFLTEGVASYVVTAKDGGSAEIGMSGTEALLGGLPLLGAYAPVADCLMQENGEAYRVPMADMRRLFEDSPEIRSLSLQSVQQQMLTLSQIAGCNRLHLATERLARWLLTASDRLETETIRLTQESLSQMLGTRRTTVALVAGSLQRSGLIRYRRANIQILDRQGLIEAACDCYGITKRLVDNLYANPFAKPERQLAMQ